MRLSSLRRFLNSEITARALISELEPELSAYRRGLSEVGRSAPVPVAEDSDVDIARSDVAFLCKAFLSGEVSSVELSFIADVIQLAERISVEDSWVVDAVAECTDPEVQGEFTAERAREIIAGAGV